MTSLLTLSSAASVPTTAQAGAAPGRAGERQVATVWDGVYTEAQAARATLPFGQSCGNCHSLTSEGRAPLAGDQFWESFAQRTVGDLLSYLTANMPNGNGGSLPASTYNDLVALILKANGFPAGMTELGPDTAANVQIIPKGGPGELPANALVRVVGCLARDGSEWVLTSATAPERIDRTGTSPQDATRPLGDRRFPLKFVLTRLDPLAGRRLSVSGWLMGTGGADGVNVATVNRVAETCP